MHLVRMSSDEFLSSFVATFSRRPAWHSFSMHSRNVLYCTLARRRILVIFVSREDTLMMSAKIWSLSRRSKLSANSLPSVFSTLPLWGSRVYCVVWRVQFWWVDFDSNGLKFLELGVCFSFWKRWDGHRWLNMINSFLRCGWNLCLCATASFLWLYGFPGFLSENRNFSLNGLIFWIFWCFVAFSAYYFFTVSYLGWFFVLCVSVKRIFRRFLGCINDYSLGGVLLGIRFRCW